MAAHRICFYGLFICCLAAVQAQYGPNFLYPQAPQPVFPTIPFLTDTHVCTQVANYHLLGLPPRPGHFAGRHFCYDATVNLDGCKTCCLITAVGNIQKSDVIGFILTVDGDQQCICCAPQQQYIAVPAPASDSIPETASQY